MPLTAAQSAALHHIREYTRTRKQAALDTITEILRMSDVPAASFDHVVAQIKEDARVGLHFHPDRFDPEGKTVAQALLESGVYKSQFETFLSSGRLSPHAGGNRDLWEGGLFGGAYNLPGSAPSERPKYGALDFMHHPDGPCPRFGSCYFLLRPPVSRRCTFTYLDSHRQPLQKGTLDELDDILAALLDEVFIRGYALGKVGLTVPRLVRHLSGAFDQPLADPSVRRPQRNLDHYIEAQVHGDVSLKEDAETLVADPSFRGTPTAELLTALSRKYEIPLYWHVGFAMPVDEVPRDFRGPEMPSLAKRIATGRYFDAAMIGAAAASVTRDPASWHDCGTPDHVLGGLKLLWHVLVRFGHPLEHFKT